jgi:hypothetical protein
VQQAVDAAEIHERTVIGQVLDDALDDGAFLQLVEQLAALGAVFLFDDRARDTTTLLRFWSSLMTLNSSVLPSR